jgi:hyperosmotically inducible periplasmic protein
MKKLTFALISSVLILTTTACQEAAKTSADAPSDATQPVTQTEAPSAGATQAAKEDAQSEVRRKQLDADIRAREQRNNATNDGKATNRPASDLASQVRSKLEANIPNGNLTVEGADGGAITVSGTVINQDQLSKIEPLSKEIKGVTSVTNKAIIKK